ncbi:MAG: tetratricopeptide repeat protein [Xenococcaceae cyanobacterium MO_167.B52]|nr:tetratricopeptide repeat protein [Xenococcaceae cyanobacterium MO_167.B52]
MNSEVIQTQSQKSRQLNKINKSSGVNLQSVLREGKQLQEAGKITQATAKYQELLELNSNFIPALNNLAMIYEDQKEFERATVYRQRIIQVKPNDSIAYAKLANAIWNQNKYQEAVSLYQKAIQLKPKLPAWVYNQLGDALSHLGQMARAVKAYKTAIEINPQSVWSYYHLGCCLEKQDQIDEAISYYAKFLQIRPDHPPALLKLSQLLSLDNKIAPNEIDKIINSLHKKIELEPNNSLLYIHLSEILTLKGHRKKAIDYCKKATHLVNVEHKPDFVEKYWYQGKVLGPNFIIIGTMKGGTSSLYQYLNQHPQILPCCTKELHFFTLNFHKGIDWYLSQFPPLPKREKFITGEASPSYLDWSGKLNHIPEQVRSLFPNVKIIALLRNPIDRAISCYSHQMRIGSAHRPFEEAVEAEFERISQVKESELRQLRGSLTAGLYIYKLQEWMKVFPTEQILILKSEYLYQETPKAVNQVFNFLGLPNHKCSSFTKYNSGSYSSMSEKLRAKLSSFYKPYNRMLEEYLGRKFNWY